MSPILFWVLSFNNHLPPIFKIHVLLVIDLNCTQHFENYPLDELVMPPPFKNATDFDRNNISNEDRQAIRDWCNTLNL